MCGLFCLMSHSLVPNEQWKDLDPVWWNNFLKEFSIGYALWHKVCLEKVASKIPTLFVRYEDLRTAPTPELEAIFKFMLDTPNIEDTVVEKRIKDMTKS